MEDRRKILAEYLKENFYNIKVENIERINNTNYKVTKYETYTVLEDGPEVDEILDSYIQNEVEITTEELIADGYEWLLPYISLEEAVEINDILDLDLDFEEFKYENKLYYIKEE